MTLRHDLARRRSQLVVRSRRLRRQMDDDCVQIEQGVAQGLSLGRLALGALGFLGAAAALRRAGARKPVWRLVAGSLRLLPLALSLWRNVQTTRQARPRQRTPR